MEYFYICINNKKIPLIICKQILSSSNLLPRQGSASSIYQHYTLYYYIIFDELFAVILAGFILIICYVIMSGSCISARNRIVKVGTKLL